MVQCMHVIRPKSLSPQDLSIVMNEVYRRVSAGNSIEDIAKDLKWSKTAVSNLLNSKEFSALLSEDDTDLIASITVNPKNAGLMEAIEFVNNRTPDYVEMLDKLAMGASSEQVRLNAILKLLTFSPFAEKATESEPFIVNDSDIERFKNAMAEVNGDRR